MKHSAGPWQDISDSPRKRRADRTALVTTRHGKRAIDATDSGRSFAEDCANARLIAAGPDLLEALVDLLEEAVVYAPAFLAEIEGAGGPLDRARAAIAKARGES